MVVTCGWLTSISKGLDDLAFAESAHIFTNDSFTRGTD
ncbi:Hypothetical protein CpCap5W_2133 [Corynebacterium pseudotuberculosis]|nr:Hypothetical protein Cp3995_2084 [Corynebacterium pseudotuberculosis 3/99-5]AIG06257.1 hypothetical protein CPTA_00428 [Corynebacterium pseudotuberculosis]AIG09157.1 hypothetical protein CPTB_01101 [Corynebacterium pseudotuberculosis]AIG11058.1 hypothetical protein CPTC_00770 [Corynebacterium pseudotuberculosis]AKJ56694.1 Hypothetical protein Cp12C_2130 [Corynebacterium pseudotuberculosis]